MHETPTSYLLMGVSIPFWQDGLYHRLTTFIHVYPAICRYNTNFS